jgi:hypothetical protein
MVSASPAPRKRISSVKKAASNPIASAQETSYSKHITEHGREIDKKLDSHTESVSHFRNEWSNQSGTDDHLGFLGGNLVDP